MKQKWKGDRIRPWRMRVKTGANVNNIKYSLYRN